MVFIKSDTVARTGLEGVPAAVRTQSNRSQRWFHAGGLKNMAIALYLTNQGN